MTTPSMPASASSHWMKRGLMLALGLAALLPRVSAGWALLAGMAFSLTLGNPFLTQTRRWTSTCLQLSVVGLGFGMNLSALYDVGAQGIGYTLVGIGATLLAGFFLGKWLKVSPSTSILVSSGTAICGGSAIAAVASEIRAEPSETAVSLSTVFLLNAAALFLFPWLGREAGLDGRQFGLWSALAIHDTSSVVGAALQYGHGSLEVATTVKLARALWIIPLVAGIGAYRKFFGGRRAEQASSPKRPWFIVGFIAAAALVTLVPSLAPTGALISGLARRALVFTLFLVGAGVSRATLREVGARPFLQGLFLWALVGSATLAALRAGWIR
jgi:uncharacterized integral membrane protein (TIGR00698 family)